MRILFWIALIVLVVMAVRSKARGMLRQQQQQQPPKPAAEPEAETMACCAHCGIHFPASEAVRADGLDYRSPAHVRLPPR